MTHAPEGKRLLDCLTKKFTVDIFFLLSGQHHPCPSTAQGHSDGPSGDLQPATWAATR